VPIREGMIQRMDFKEVAERYMLRAASFELETSSSGQCGIMVLISILNKKILDKEYN
jgi:hypothetical protein